MLDFVFRFAIVAFFFYALHVFKFMFYLNTQYLFYHASFIFTIAFEINLLFFSFETILFGHLIISIGTVLSDHLYNSLIRENPSFFIN